MIRKLCFVISLSFFLASFAAGCSTIVKTKTFENDSFSFTIPARWKTTEEIWKSSDVSGQEYYGLGVQGVVTIQYPAIKGKGKAFFAVASSQLPEGQDLATRIAQAYQMASPEVEDADQRSFELGNLTGYEITYKRPWGEPWWKFRDIWIEKGGEIYVLSFHASPTSFDTYKDVFEQILESFQFNN